jgi:hypothetical protein
MKEEINKTYDLPENFAALVEYYYISSPKPIDDKEQLIRFWQAALDARKQHPEIQESVAHWAMSCGASSPLIGDQGLLEEIHFIFGELEIAGNTEKTQRKWDYIEKLITEAGKS